VGVGGSEVWCGLPLESRTPPVGRIAPARRSVFHVHDSSLTRKFRESSVGLVLSQCYPSVVPVLSHGLSIRVAAGSWGLTASLLVRRMHLRFSAQLPRAN